jgi:membrane protease YdiL (CAAX protease family)
MLHPFPQRRPLLFSGLLLLLVLGTVFIAGAIATILHWPAISIAIVGDSVLALVAVFLLSRLRWWREVGFRLPAPSRALWFFLVPCLAVVANAVFARLVNPAFDNVLTSLLLYFAVAMLVGLVEETYFRGLMLRALLVRGPWQAAIISSVLFSLAHLLNIGVGQNLAATLVQIVDAFAIGFLFAALALRTHTILPLIVIHGLTNFFGFLALNGTVVTQGLNVLAVVVTAAEVLIYLTVGVIVLRGVREAEPTPTIGAASASAVVGSGT